VSADLTIVAETTSARVARLARPLYALRTATWAFIVAGVAAQLVTAQIVAARFLRLEAVDAPRSCKGLKPPSTC
jgi:hypothetical protein